MTYNFTGDKSFDYQRVLGLIHDTRNVAEKYDLLLQYVARYGRDRQLEFIVNQHREHDMFRLFERVFDECGISRDELVKHLPGYINFISFKD